MSRSRLSLALALLAGLLLAPAVASASCATPTDIRTGRYVNVDPGTGTVTALEISFVCGAIGAASGEAASNTTTFDPELQLRMWGACFPNDCDWGNTPIRRIGAGVSRQAIYDQGFARRAVVFGPMGNQLRVRITTTYSDSRPTQTWTETFRPD